MKTNVNMKINTQMTSKKFTQSIVALSLICSTSGNAEIYLDREADPIPMVEMNIAFPVGFEARSMDDVGAANLMADMIQAGTEKLARQDFQEKLAEFGATFNFSVGNQFSEYELSFPFVEGKNYDALIATLTENWWSPRFDEKTFEIAKTKIISSMQGGLDNDFSLVSTTLRRYLNLHEFGGFPLFIEGIEKLKLSKVKEVFARDFQNIDNVWAGVLAPDASLDLVKKILQSILKKQGKIVEGPYLKELPTLSKKKKSPSAKKVVLLIDKSQRAQTVTGVMAVSKRELESEEELAFIFGNHVLFDSGMASVFADEIRTKKGLAYSVGSSTKQLYEKPVLSVSMNPVRERQEEALSTMAKLLTDSFENNKVISGLSEEVYAQQLRSFKNSKILSQSTPQSRLAEKASVVMGGISKEFFLSNPNEWNPKAPQVYKVLNSLWANSAIVVALVGEAAELKPLLEKYYPAYKIKVIPYKDSLSQKAYE